MNTTFKCTNCGHDGLTNANPWHDCYDTKMQATRTEILRLKDLQNNGRLMSGMGVRPWDRERGAATAHRATTALRNLMSTLTIEDLAYIRDINTEVAR